MCIDLKSAEKTSYKNKPRHLFLLTETMLTQKRAIKFVKLCQTFKRVRRTNCLCVHISILHLINHENTHLHECKRINMLTTGCVPAGGCFSSCAAVISVNGRKRPRRFITDLDSTV